MGDTNGRPSTKDAIWAAASRQFAERGYAGTSVRDIAAEAGVDAALVIRHWTSKENLFLETMRLELGDNALLDGPVETLGERFVAYVLTSDDRVRGVFIALLRASDAGDIGSRLRATHDAAFVEPLLGRLEGPDAELRARLAAALVGGLLYSLWVVGDDRLAAADPADVIRRYGALLQELITPQNA